MLTAEQSKAIRDAISNAERVAKDYEEEVAKMRRAGLSTTALEAELKSAKETLAKIKAVYG